MEKVIENHCMPCCLGNIDTVRDCGEYVIADKCPYFKRKNIEYNGKIEVRLNDYALRAV